MPFPPLSGRATRPPKGLRKGTRSCLECRERKIRCILVSDEQACQGCILRGSECLDQQHRLPKAEIAQRKRERHQKRVEISDLVSEILQKLASGLDEAPRTKSETAVIEVLKRFQSELPLPEKSASNLPLQTSFVTPSSPCVGELLSTHRERLDEVPLVNLLTKGTHHGQDTLLAEAGIWRPPRVKCSRAAETLKAIVPRGSDLTLILENGQRGWGIWQKAFPESKRTDVDGQDLNQVQNLQSFINLVLSTDEVVNIAKIVLCVALCIQQLPPNTDLIQAHLPASAEALEAQFLAPIESYFSTNDRCACTLEGLECILIQTRIYINAGKPHKAWLLFRRGVNIAHLLGLHRQTTSATSHICRLKRNLWLQIWQGERYLSLLLGLPYTASDKYLLSESYEVESQGDGDVELVQIQLGVVAGLLIDRDQALHGMSVTVTIKIEEDLDRCQKLMPKGCWDSFPDPQMSLQTISAISAAKFTIFNLRKLLFLPFMLQDDNKHDFARTAALEASREMIKVYHVMRDLSRPLFEVCNMADFQVFTAAMVLIIDLVSSRPQETTEMESDWNIIYRLTQELRRVSAENPKSAATHAAKILDDIYKLRLGPLAGSGQSYTANVPYFGRLTVNLCKADGIENLNGMASDNAETPYNAAIAGTCTSPMDYQGFTFDSYASLLENDLTMDWTSNVDFNLCNDWTSFFNSEGSIRS